MSLINAQAISNQASGLAASIHAPADSQDVTMSGSTADQAAAASYISPIPHPIISMPPPSISISDSPIVVLADSSTDSLLTSSTLFSSDSKPSPPLSHSFASIKTTISKHITPEKTKGIPARPDTPIPDLDRPIPYRRPRSLTERHPLLHRRSAITLEILDPHTLTAYGFHIGQIAVFIATDGRLRRGQPPTEFTPAAYTTFVTLFNSVEASECLGIKFTIYDDSTNTPIITGNAPRLTDFDIPHDDVYPATDSPPSNSHSDSRRHRDQKSSSTRSSRSNGSPRLNIAKLTKDAHHRKTSTFARFDAM